MRSAMFHGPADIKVVSRPDPEIINDSDAVVRVVRTCVCGSDLWWWRGANQAAKPFPIGHEFVGIVETVGTAVATVKPGDFVIAPFMFSDNDCKLCRLGMHTSCIHGGGWGGKDAQGNHVDGAQGEIVRVPLADGTLVATPEVPSESKWADLLTLSDVFPTGHHAAVSARVQPGSSVVVIGDGAVGLSAVLAAKRLGAGRIIAMSRHSDRQELAKAFGADEIITERGEEGAALVKEITEGFGADHALECVGTSESMKQACKSVRPGGSVGYVGVPHDVKLHVPALFANNISLAGGVAPVRAYIEELLEDVWSEKVRPGLVFDHAVTLSNIADGYRAMDGRHSIKTMVDVR